MDNFKSIYENNCAQVTNEIYRTLMRVDVKNLEKLLIDILSVDQVFLIGVGRVMLSLQSVAKRMAHLGIAVHCVGEITEPAITDKDLLIVASGSGTSIIPLEIARKAKKFNAKIVHIGSNRNSEMKDLVDYMVCVPVRTRLYLPDEGDSCQIMTSLFEQVLLILGDIMMKMIVEDKNIDLKSLWKFHANLE